MEEKKIRPLEESREEIRQLDDQILALFQKRMKAAQDVADYKQANHLPILNAAVEEEKLEKLSADLPEDLKEYSRRLYRAIFSISRDYQESRMKKKQDGLKCGLLGKTLGHSYSPQIHRELAGYSYQLFEKSQEELEEFLLHGDWTGLNVTIPYKKTVMPYCTELSEIAQESGSVNTLVKRPDGSIFGDNTDAFGFASMLRKYNIEAKGKKVLILGNGGACASVQAVLKHAGAEVIVISRRGENNYQNLQLHRDARILVNTTPVGMYPNNGESPVDLVAFPDLEAVLDIVYNPARTELLLQAEEKGLIWGNGIYMLVAQAKKSSEEFSGNEIPEEKIEEISRKLSYSMQNIVLIGMPGCGKSTIAEKLAELSGREVLELDEEFEQHYGYSPAQCILEQGESEFRRKESQLLKEAGKRSACIISTGGGCVTVPENYKYLHQNGRIVWIKRDLEHLEISGRPLSQQQSLEALYEKRAGAYEAFADFVIENETDPKAAAQLIMEKLA